MSETTQDENEFEAAIRLRLTRIVDAKREETEASVGALRGLADSWAGLHRELDEQIQGEFSRMEFESQVAGRAEEMLDGPSAPASKPGRFVVALRVVDSRRQVGLPGLRMALEQEGGAFTSTPRTDLFGNCTVDIPATEEPSRASLAIKVSDGSGVIHQETQTLSAAAGQTASLTIRVNPTERSDWLAAADLVRDSVKADSEMVRARLTDMQTAHTAVTSVAKMGLEDVKSLASVLSTAAPVIESRPAAGAPARRRTHRSSSGPEPWSVRGTVKDASGAAQPGLLVEWFDKDRLYDDTLGTALTDAGGAYQVTFDRREFAEAGETGPDLYCRVRDTSGRVLYSSLEKVKPDAAREEVMDIVLPSTVLTHATAPRKAAPRRPGGKGRGKTKR